MINFYEDPRHVQAIEEDPRTLPIGGVNRPSRHRSDAAQHLRDKEMTIVIVGDRAVIEGQVRPFGPAAK